MKNSTHLGFRHGSLRMALFCTVVTLLTFAGCTGSQSPHDPASLEIQSRITAGGMLPPVRVQSDSAYSYNSLLSFYKERAFRPAWSTPKNILPDADSVVALIRNADREGLRPLDYHLVALESTIMALNDGSASDGVLDPAKRAELDILLTDAWLLYASHSFEGCVDRDSLRLRWSATGTKMAYDSLLKRSLDDRMTAENLRKLVPQHPMYSELRDLLASYRVMAHRGRWGTVPPGPALKGGDAGSRVFALKGRLRVSGDLVSRSGAGGDEYDSTLVDAVRAFQRRHLLGPSGIADSSTIATMNVPIEKRIEQIKINLERWRWMPHELGRKTIVVNIPDFRLSVFEEGKVVETMKVVLGLATWQTPVFSAQLTQVLLNSHWMAPEDIVEKELINYMKADSNYLKSNNMTLWREVHDSLVQVDPRTIDWPSMNEKNIDFRLRQDPGPQNIMGQIKFLIPNKYSVYLHDTPYREDFQKTVRTCSHGCIRLEKPADLAEYVLKEFPQWSRERIDTVIAHNTEQSLVLRKPIPVHVVYCTVWREKDGSIQFREDCYGLDRRLGSALQAAQSKPISPFAASLSKTALD
jgi:L,D-transpeptidase YcbB